MNLDMGARLDLAAVSVPGPRAPVDDQTTPLLDQEKAEPPPMQAER